MYGVNLYTLLFHTVKCTITYIIVFITNVRGQFIYIIIFIQFILSLRFLTQRQGRNQVHLHTLLFSRSLFRPRSFLIQMRGQAKVYTLSF